ncbi:TPA: phage tail protein [Klebsiella variicola]|uniref:phage tail-collar fiber domain-containing protein n=1 Tax=Klebsiella quasipneumoniae TaxID=1463165 RepID=UPI002B18C539|nr:phage tail protein [Klebsiella variicola]
MSFGLILTAVGASEIEQAYQAGEVVRITAVAFGDGGGAAVTADPAVTNLINPIGEVPFSQGATERGMIAGQAIINARDYPGKVVREFGLMSAEGVLIAYGAYPETYLPDQSDTIIKELVVKFIMPLTHTECVQLIVDPNIAVITQESGDKRYYRRSLRLEEVKNDGEDAQQEARDNIGCGTAAIKDVGTQPGQLIQVGGFGIGLDSSATTAIDFTSYIFRTGEILKLDLSRCQNVPAFLSPFRDVYLQCAGVRERDFGCWLILSDCQDPEKTFFAHRENNTNANWEIMQVANAERFSLYLPLDGGVVTGDLSVNGLLSGGNGADIDGEVNVTMNRDGSFPDGIYINGGLLRSFVGGRGAYHDPRGAYAALHIQERTGVSHQAVLNLNGYGQDNVWVFRNDGSFCSPGVIIEGDQRVYSPNNPPPLPQIVQDVQFGARVLISGVSSLTQTPPGCVMVSLAGDSDNDTSGYYAPLQKNINGTWITVSG